MLVWKKALAKILAPLMSMAAFPQTSKGPESCPLSFCSQPLQTREDVCSNQQMQYMYDPNAEKTQC